MAAFLTETQRTSLYQAYELLAKSYVTEQQGIPEDVAKKLARIASDLGFSEPNILLQLRDRPIKTILAGIIYLNDNA